MKTTPLPSNKFTTIDTFAEPVETPTLKTAIEALSKSASVVMVMLKNEPGQKTHTAAEHADRAALEWPFLNCKPHCATGSNSPIARPFAWMFSDALDGTPRGGVFSCA